MSKKVCVYADFTSELLLYSITISIMVTLTPLPCVSSSQHVDTFIVAPNMDHPLPVISIQQHFITQKNTYIEQHLGAFLVLKCYLFNEKLGGIFLNMSPPTYFTFLVTFVPATACRVSNTVHSKSRNYAAIAIAIVPVPPPTSTSEPSPSNTLLHS